MKPIYDVEWLEISDAPIHGVYWSLIKLHGHDTKVDTRLLKIHYNPSEMVEATDVESGDVLCDACEILRYAEIAKPENTQV